jgi:hypothetical protein
LSALRMCFSTDSLGMSHTHHYSIVLGARPQGLPDPCSFFIEAKPSVFIGDSRFRGKPIESSLGTGQRFEWRHPDCRAFIIFIITDHTVMFTNARFVDNHLVSEAYTTHDQFLSEETWVEIRCLTSIGYSAGQIRFQLASTVPA